MNKFLSSLLASTLLLGAVGTSFALETTETMQNTETSLLLNYVDGHTVASWASPAFG